MSRCTKPLYALDLGIKENGKRAIKILPRRIDLYSLAQIQARYGVDSVIPLPCGKCLACRLGHAKEWAIRCVLEASLYDENWFVTLTYDAVHLPSDLKLHREHFQDFMKKLRHYVPGVRVFYCGEYGSVGKRPHFHAILFNCPVGVKPHKANNSYYWTSATLEKCWSKGFVQLGEVTYSSCNYVAQYCTKKITEGSKNGEFIGMSLKPGIGGPWFEQHYDIFDNDAIYGKFGNSKAVKIPRYFEKLFETVSPERLEEVKEMRINKSSAVTINEMIIHSTDAQEKLLDYKANCQINDFKRKKRRLDL